jgi:cell division septum initiation protein DivIVA
MPIKPEDINAENLPQGVRGYQREATENLLKLVAWDYRRVIREHAVDKEELQRLRTQNDQFETELQALRSLLDSQPADQQLQVSTQVAERTAALQAEVDRLQTALGQQAHRAQLSETLLESALRSARQLREETRAECDSILHAARRRALEIENDARRTVRRAGGEVERLQQMERDLREQLRRILESVIDGQNKPAATAEPGEPPAAPTPAEDTLTLPPSWTSASD